MEKPIEVKVENVVKSYGKSFAIRDVSLDIRPRRAAGAAWLFRLRQDDVCCASWPASISQPTGG